MRSLGGVFITTLVGLGIGMLVLAVEVSFTAILKYNGRRIVNVLSK